MAAPEPSPFTPPAPARIWVLLASDAPTAVVFRRGPSRWTRLYLWDLHTDTFTPGSWFAGHLYPWSSDLSPDGKHLLYLARNESKHRQEQARKQFGLEHLYSWTALCRPPWVRALGLWNASSPFSAGGAFTSNTAFTLFHDSHMQQALIEPEGFETTHRPPGEQGSTVLRGLYRNGWQQVPIPESLPSEGDEPRVSLKKGPLELCFVLRRYRWRTVYRWTGPGPVEGLSEVSWADLDHRGQLLYARSGVLYRHHEGQEVLLRDLNLDQPRREKAGAMPQQRDAT